MNEVDRATQKLWDGDQAIEQSDYAKPKELLEWVVRCPLKGDYE